jgi:hypothetical protein
VKIYLDPGLIADPVFVWGLKAGIPNMWVISDCTITTKHWLDH